jgi:TonB family protein
MREVPGPAQMEQTPSAVADLCLLVELPSRRRVFFGNFRDLFRPHEAAPLDLRSAPAPFWPDVFVARGLPWRRFFESGACHVLALATIWAASRFLVFEPQAVPRAALTNDDVIYYTPEEYLPPLDTRQPDSTQPLKADPEYSEQPIISVPPEAYNRSQTIVAPPNVKLKQDVALPNVVAWTDRPRMPIAPAPVIMASSISRLVSPVENQVVAPAPDLARAEPHRDIPGMQTSIIAPPPDVQLSAPKALTSPQAAVIAPPPAVEATSARRPGDINIGRSTIIAPAPRLTLDAKRAIVGGNSAALSLSPQIVAPPPSLRTSSSGSSSSASGGGRMIALNLHPTVGAPPDPPAGNRRGTFAATPQGHRGASGTPSSAAAESAGTDGHGAGNRREDGLPSGLYVGKASNASLASPVAGNPAGKTSANLVNPNLIASARLPRVSSTRTTQPEIETRLSEEEREVFRDRKFYSLTLNMPNLNSAGGSWIIRFAELKKNSSASSKSDATASDLSAPSATRKVDPAYPLELMRQNVAGTVILFGVIHADGTVGSVRVLRSVDDRLDQYASEALSRWQFQPATKDGAPVDVEATFQIPFRPGRLRSTF